MAAPAEDFGAFFDALARPAALVEIAALAACLAAAGLLVRLARGQARRPSSVWFGERIVDGLLFPVLTLGGALLARWLLARHQPVAVLQVAVPILASLVVIRLAVRVLRVAFPDSHPVRVVERTLSWFVWGVLVLWLSGLLPLVLAEMEAVRWKVGGADVNLRSLIEGTLTAGVVLVAALWVSAAIESRLLAGASDNLSVRKIAANAVRALLLLVGILLAMSAAGIPVGALGVLGGALGVGIGFGLQKLAANYVSGFVILAERSLRIGDVVRVDGFEGRVTDIKTRYTVVRALNGRESIVPNEMLITQRVENSSLADPKVALTTTVQVAYGTDLDALLPCLAHAVSQVPRVIQDPAPSVQLAAFAADGLELQVSFWIADPEAGQGNVRSDVNLAVLRTLEAADVEIPYPQRVLRRATALQARRE
ncbi:MAG TPA: mechanosensitive ion channel domain-containing protein [Burkholderiaceae bacterium]|nr:mechanosensitive ion channel domain-containing protein [Burkholderiaceae bacterium]